MKKLMQRLSVLVVICMLITMMPKVNLADEEAVKSVTAKLEEIDTLQEMQNARERFKASDTYSDETAENHEFMRAEYEKYLADMLKARTEAAQAYAALSKEEQALIDSTLVQKLDDKLDTVWNDEIPYNVSAGVHDYRYQVVYPSYAYELSNHMVSNDGGKHNEIPQTLVLVDTDKYGGGEWTPNMKYSFGNSNYEVVYCSDVRVGVVDRTLYQRVNLEDSTYYDAKAAEHIRAIVSNSYPYLSLDQMKDNLAKEGFEDAKQLTRSDIIAAVQMAIWSYSNGTEMDGNDFEYSGTFDWKSNPRWGSGFHDYTNELWDWWSVAYRHLTVNKETGDRVNKLATHLKGLKGEQVNTNQIVINEVKIEGAEPVQAKEDAYKVALKVRLNNGGTSEEDNIIITVKTQSQTIDKKVEQGIAEYDIVIEAMAGEAINVLVEGKQMLPKGAYLYIPQPADKDGDDIATGREASQVLVGVAEGLTAIQATDSVTLEIPETDPVKANLQLKKTDEKGVALTGAEFDLYFLGKKGTYKIETFPVDENGFLEVKDLLPGNYELVESVVPEGYVDPEKPIAFSIDEKGDLTLTDSAVAKLIDNVVVVKNYLPPTPPPVKPRGSLSIKKVDSVSKETLEGATFTLKGKNFQRTLTTGKDGTLLFSGLAYGEYTLTETEAPAGYVKDTTKWPIKIGVGEGAQRYWVQEVENTPIGSLEVIKTDIDTGETLEGAEFRLTNHEGNVVDTLTTDESGKVTFKNLPYGEYKLEETKAPVGYVKDATEWPIKIGVGEGAQRYWVQEVENTPVGSLEVIKTDIDTGETLKGAAFRLTNPEGNVVGTLITDESGKVTFENLPYGEYKLEETKAPVGYVLNKESKTIKLNNQIVKYEYPNKAIKGSVKVVKQDEDGNLLAGAEFTLTQGKEIISKATTNAEGVVEFVGLSYGVEYKVTETKAPEGYLLSKEATDTFTIFEDGQKEEFTYENIREKPSLAVEKTADKTQYVPGETVTYTINVTNDGNVDLKGITLEDVFSKNGVKAEQQLTVEGYDGAFDLAVGETLSFISKYVIPYDDDPDTTYNNVVTTTVGEISTGVLDEATIVVDPTTEDDISSGVLDEAGNVDDPTYAFTIEKTADKNQVTVGDTVTYSIVITNTGNEALTNVLVKDDMIGLETVIDQLAVNESRTLLGEYVVTADDIGELENIATATVEDAESLTHDASVIVEVTAKAEGAVDETDQVIDSTQNPQTGDTTINNLLVLLVFVLVGSGLYIYRRKYRG